MNDVQFWFGVVSIPFVGLLFSCGGFFVVGCIWRVIARAANG